MKITLDVGKLVEEGRLTPDEAKRLIALAAEGTGSLAMNMLIGELSVLVAGHLSLDHYRRVRQQGFVLNAALWKRTLTRTRSFNVATSLMLCGTMKF